MSGEKKRENKEVLPYNVVEAIEVAERAFPSDWTYLSKISAKGWPVFTGISEFIGSHFDEESVPDSMRGHVYENSLTKFIYAGGDKGGFNLLWPNWTWNKNCSEAINRASFARYTSFSSEDYFIGELTLIGSIHSHEDITDLFNDTVLKDDVCEKLGFGYWNIFHPYISLRHFTGDPITPQIYVSSKIPFENGVKRVEEIWEETSRIIDFFCDDFDLVKNYVSKKKEFATASDGLQSAFKKVRRNGHE